MQSMNNLLEVLRVLHDGIQVLHVLQPLLALRLLLLDALHLLGDARLSQRLPFAPLVGLGVERRLQRRVRSHARHYFGAQILLELEQPQCLQLNVHFQSQLVGHELGRERLESTYAILHFLVDHVLPLLHYFEGV